MASTDGPKSPSRPTVKRLFAVSRNLCAFPKCSATLIDPLSGSVVGEICHIKGAKPDSARYDTSQTDEERHHFDNLVLLCNIHHKIIDDDEKSYTADRLIEMKQLHEASNAEFTPVDDASVEHFINVAIHKSTIQGSVISSHGQTGGQTAHSINNYYNTPTENPPIQLNAKLDHAGDLKTLRTYGCPGMRLTVICISSRPAMIQSAHLQINDVDVMDGFRQGFGADFGYTPLAGSTQTMDVKLIPMNTPNSEEGYILNQGEVARFFYPFPIPPTTLALSTSPANLSMRVCLFDDSERVLLTGQKIKSILQGVFNIHQNRLGQFIGPINIGVKVKSTRPPGPEMGDLIGKVNTKTIPFDTPDATK